MRGLSLVTASGGHSSSQCTDLSLSRPLLLRSTGSRRAGSVVVVHRHSCSAACGIFPDQGSNPCPLHWQADSQPLCHQGSPGSLILGEAGCHIVRTLKQPYREAHGARNWGLLPRASHVQKPCTDDAAQADSLTTTSWEILNQKHPTKSLLDSWPTETKR